MSLVINRVPAHQPFPPQVGQPVAGGQSVGVIVAQHPRNVRK